MAFTIDAIDPSFGIGSHDQSSATKVHYDNGEVAPTQPSYLKSNKSPTSSSAEGAQTASNAAANASNASANAAYGASANAAANASTSSSTDAANVSNVSSSPKSAALTATDSKSGVRNEETVKSYLHSKTALETKGATRLGNEHRDSLDAADASHIDHTYSQSYSATSSSLKDNHQNLKNEKMSALDSVVDGKRANGASTAKAVGDAGSALSKGAAAKTAKISAEECAKLKSNTLDKNSAILTECKLKGETKDVKGGELANKKQAKDLKHEDKHSDYGAIALNDEGKLSQPPLNIEGKNGKLVPDTEAILISPLDLTQIEAPRIDTYGESSADADKGNRSKYNTITDYGIRQSSNRFDPSSLYFVIDNVPVGIDMPYRSYAVNDRKKAPQIKRKEYTSILSRSLVLDNINDGTNAMMLQDQNYYRFGVYAGYTYDDVKFTADLNYSTLENFTGMSSGIKQLKSSADATSISAGFTIKRHIDVGGIRISPHIGTRFTRLNLDNFQNPNSPTSNQARAATNYHGVDTDYSNLASTNAIQGFTSLYSVNDNFGEPSSDIYYGGSSYIEFGNTSFNDSSSSGSSSDTGTDIGAIPTLPNAGDSQESSDHDQLIGDISGVTGGGINSDTGLGNELGSSSGSSSDITVPPSSGDSASSGGSSSSGPIINGGSDSLPNVPGDDNAGSDGSNNNSGSSGDDGNTGSNGSGDSSSNGSGSGDNGSHGSGDSGSNGGSNGSGSGDGGSNGSGDSDSNNDGSNGSGGSGSNGSGNGGDNAGSDGSGDNGSGDGSGSGEGDSDGNNGDGSTNNGENGNANGENKPDGNNPPNNGNTSPGIDNGLVSTPRQMTNYQYVNVVSVPVGITFSKNFTHENWLFSPSLDLTVTNNFGTRGLDNNERFNLQQKRSLAYEAEVLDEITYSSSLGFSAMNENMIFDFGLNYTSSERIKEFGANARARFTF